MLAWGPAFLGRVHHMSSVEIGTWLGLIIGFGGSLGAYLGGRLTDRLGRHDQRWYVLLSALVCLGAMPFAAGFLLVDRTVLALLSFVPACVLSNMYVGPMLSMTQGLVPPHMRATASAILLFILNLIGLGAGPLVVGALSDGLVPRFGADYDIVPGHPEDSILPYRMESIEPDVAMPELGRQLTHEEGVAVVSEWIASLPGSCE